MKCLLKDRVGILTSKGLMIACHTLICCDEYGVTDFRILHPFTRTLRMIHFMLRLKKSKCSR